MTNNIGTLLFMVFAIGWTVVACKMFEKPKLRWIKINKNTLKATITVLRGLK